MKAPALPPHSEGIPRAIKAAPLAFDELTLVRRLEVGAKRMSDPGGQFFEHRALPWASS